MEVTMSHHEKGMKDKGGKKDTAGSKDTKKK
jgi:hypothetical protein